MQTITRSSCSIRLKSPMAFPICRRKRFRSLLNSNWLFRGSLCARSLIIGAARSACRGFRHRSETDRAYLVSRVAMIGDTALRRKILHRIMSDNRHRPTRTQTHVQYIAGCFLALRHALPAQKADKAALTHPQKGKELEFLTI